MLNVMRKGEACSDQQDEITSWSLSPPLRRAIFGLLIFSYTAFSSLGKILKGSLGY